jgi:Restriction Enzyme Adenine Methylase Associated
MENEMEKNNEDKNSSKGRRLVREHLEKISWEVLETYPEVVNGLIRRRFGVYALYKGSRLYYVGLATNLMGRLKQHLKDRHKGLWDHFSVYLTIHNEHIKELESLLLRIVEPPGNAVGGRLVASQNLFSTLNQQIVESDADNRASLLGGYVAQRRQRAKAKKAKGKGALKGLVPRRLLLKAWKDDYEYSASLRKDGTIQYNGEVFDTPNAAARAALGKPAGGWNFWHFKNEDKEWVPLLTFKKH